MLRFVWRSQVMVLTLTIPSLLESKFSHFDVRASLKKPLVSLALPTSTFANRVYL